MQWKQEDCVSATPPFAPHSTLLMSYGEGEVLGVQGGEGDVGEGGEGDRRV